MKKKKLSLNKLFQNNKFLIILALVISTITWVYMSMGTTNDTTVTISNIPIQIELPDQLDNNGLQVFRDAEQTATVTVTGSRAVLGSIGTKDITVTGTMRQLLLHQRISQSQDLKQRLPKLQRFRHRQNLTVY